MGHAHDQAAGTHADKQEIRPSLQLEFERLHTVFLQGITYK